MRVFFLVGSGIGNQAETVPAFNLAKKKYPDITVVNTEPYNMDATKVLFKGLAPVKHVDEVKATDADLRIATYFCLRGMELIPPAFKQRPTPGRSEVEFNMTATGLNFTDEDFSDCGSCLEYIEPRKDAPDVILHDGYNKKLCGQMGKEKWMAKSYLHWSNVALLLKEKGYRVGSIGSPDEYVKGTENLTGLELEDSIAAMKGSRVVMCNDTGTFHISNLIQKWNIVVFTFTADDKNFDKRFHKYSKLMRGDLPCSPCQMKGRHYWYYNRPNCKWACRGSIPPEKLAEECMGLM